MIYQVLIGVFSGFIAAGLWEYRYRLITKAGNAILIIANTFTFIGLWFIGKGGSLLLSGHFG